jgi:hypothetical protein
MSRCLPHPEGSLFSTPPVGAGIELSRPPITRRGPFSRSPVSTPLPIPHVRLTACVNGQAGYLRSALRFGHVTALHGSGDVAYVGVPGASPCERPLISYHVGPNLPL